MNGPPPPAGSPSPRGGIETVELIALGLLIAVGLAAWGVGLRTAGYDYDEVTRAHSVWLAAQGLRPYNDFFECHPPYFRLLAPAIQGRPNPLLALRGVAAVGNLLFLGGLGVLGASLLPESRRWAWLGVAVVAGQPAVLAFLVEFRIDGWGYALAAWSLYRHHRLATGVYRDFELGVGTGVATLLLCPKLTFLPGLVVICGQLRAGGSARRLVVAVGAYAAGVGVATALFVGFLLGQAIDLDRMFQLLVRYHAVSGSNAGSRLGLLWAIIGHRELLGLILAGLAAWGLSCLRRKTWPDGYMVALVAWLAAQAILVAYPYKQYFAPWFLFASGFLGFLGQGRWTWAKPVRFLFVLAACAVTGFGAIDLARGWVRSAEAGSQERVIAWMNQVARPGDRVVASPPFHPIDRFDTFFVWFNTADPAGFDSEQILARLPSYRDRVTPGRFAAELEAHPPALVLLSGSWRLVPYTEGQQQALARFLPGRGYRIVAIGSIQVAVRPDCLNRTRWPR